MDVEAEVLFKKGKRFAAAYLQVECAKSPNPPLLRELLDILLDPKKSLDSWDTIDWCRFLMAGGKTPDEYGQIVRRYDNATTCGLVWTANFVAYRCRTCGISPCMSLCSECFLQGNHEGHDFNMFRSQAGGACDCGDTSVMKESGFCLKHGPKAQMNKPQVPPDLLRVAEAMMPRIFLRLIQHLREHSRLVQDFSAIQEADGFIAMLHQYSELGGAMRGVMTQALINPNVYHELAVECYDPNDPEKSLILKRNYEFYLSAKERLSSYEVPDDLLFIKAIQPELQHNTFLEELVFWTVKFEFPQKLVCFLLNMLPDQNYKVSFTQTFVNHYSRVSVMLANSGSSDTLSNRVVHVSVQLFSNEDLTLKMTKEFHLLYTMIISIKAMMDKIILQNTLQDIERNFHFVVDCSHPIMKDHCYWPVVSDLNNVLTHRPVAYEFLKDSKLLDMWFSFLVLFQGMNVNQREMRQHVEFEPNTYYAAFLAELEASATPMWALIAHLKEPDTAHLTKQVIQRCLLSLIEWFDAIGMPSGDMPNPYQVSFHLPLHRYLSVFLCQAIVHQGIPSSDVIPGPETLKSVMLHPLQAQVAFHEILSGMWVRNGLQIKGQAMTYIQCHFCNSTVDADLFLLQLCAGNLDPDWFVQTVLERFQVWEWLSFKELNVLNYLGPEQLMPMLEGALTFLATLVDIHTNLGMTEEEITRQEMIALLCMNDRTHSQLMELLPEKCGTTSQNKDFETILSQIADYKAPNFEAGGNMVQGIYVPKAEIWEKEYDPVQVLLRAVHRRDFQASVDRYTHYLRQSGKYHGTGAPWLPFRIPQNVHKEIKDPRRILQSQTLHGVIFTILHRACSNPLITEQIVSLSVYLLELALRFPTTSLASNHPDKDSMSLASLECYDLDYKSWFPSNNTLQNICHPVHNVVIMDKSDSTLSTRSSTNGLNLSGSLGNIALLGSESNEGEDSSPVEAMAASSYHDSMVNMVEEMEVDEEMNNYMDELLMDQFDSVYEVQSPVAEDGTVSIPGSTQPSLPTINSQLALPSSSETCTEQALVPLALRAIVPQSSMEGNSETALTRSTTSEDRDSSPPRSPTAPLPVEAPTFEPENKGLVLSRRLVAPPRLQLSLHQLSLRRHTVPNKPNLSNIWSLSSMKALPNCSSRPQVEIHETFFTLLMRLHSKFSGKPDSYQPPFIGPKPISSEEMKNTGDVEKESEETRMGDGSLFIRQLLDYIIRLYGSQRLGEQLVKSARQRIWPNLVTKDANNSPNSSKIPTMDKEERRRKAKERQQKLMAEFASRQKAFMEQSMKLNSEGTDCGMDDGTGTSAGEGETDYTETEAKEYECIICGQTTPTTYEKPVGMVVLIQATSILGHSHQLEIEKRRLPCNDEEMRQFKKDGRLGVYMERRVEQMYKYFDNSSWQLAVNIGWEGGVHVQSCGHYLHMDCQKSYIQSLRSQSHQTQRQQNLAVESGEYFCPLCRQLANSVLPLNPEASVNKESMALIRSHPNKDLHELADELGQFFAATPVPVPSMLKKMGNIMEDLTVATYPRYRSFCNPDSHGLHLFVCSIARTNLEMELLLRKGSLCSPAVRKSCFVPLFQVLACHAKVLARAQFVQWWLQLSGLPPKDQFSSLTPVIQEVPIFLRDISAILIQLILSLRSTVHKAYYSCVVQILFNVAYAQALAQLSCNLTLKQRLKFKERASDCDSMNNQSEMDESSPSNKLTFGGLLGSVIDYLEHSNLYIDDDELEPELKNREWLELELERNLEALCLPFLRIASLLQSHLYTEDLPQIHNEELEFNSLCKYLGLGKKGTQSIPTTPTGPPELSSVAYLQWATQEPLSLINGWCQNMICFVNKCSSAARGFLVERPLRWYPPVLLRLPHNYNQIFQYYHRMLCVVCHGIPKDPSLCLICGTLVCLRENCCRQQVLSEAVAHSISCGAGTAMFLTVNSSTIVVIRGKRACLWGSVYLDKFGEEDRDLKRGKPLYLSQDRYRLLEHQWLSHSFDHTNKRWVWHRDNL